MIYLELFVLLLMIAAILFFLWMFLDCIYHEPEYDHLWLLLLLLGNVFAAVVYYVYVARPRDRVFEQERLARQAMRQGWGKPHAPLSTSASHPGGGEADELSV